jgi:hypothetical protein
MRIRRPEMVAVLSARFSAVEVVISRIGKCPEGLGPLLGAGQLGNIYKTVGSRNLE